MPELHTDQEALKELYPSTFKVGKETMVNFHLKEKWVRVIFALFVKKT